MIKNILEITNKLVNSDSHYDLIYKISQTFKLNEDELGYLTSNINSVILGVEKESNFVENLEDSLEEKKQEVKDIYLEVKKLIFDPFKKSIASIVDEHIQETSSTPSPSLVRESKEEEPLTHAAILAGIENPPRTVLKRYVLEHEPITDPKHLIDDGVDERLRIE